MPKAACALKLELGPGMQHLDKYFISVLTSLPTYLIEFNIP